MPKLASDAVAVIVAGHILKSKPVTFEENSTTIGSHAGIQPGTLWLLIAFFHSLMWIHRTVIR